MKIVKTWLPVGLGLVGAAIGLLLVRVWLRAQWRRAGLELHDGFGFTDPLCTTGYCDYVMFWLAGMFGRHGQAALLYDHARYAAMAAAMLPYKTGYWPFVYPPLVLPLTASLSLLPLVPGYYVFSAVGTGISIWLLRRAGLAWWCILAGLLSPMALWNLYLGQLGVLCAALLVAGLIWLPTRPFLAGLLLGLLCIKPQYALLVPAVVLAGRHGRAMFAGAGVVAAMALLSLWLGGASVWLAYLGPGHAAMQSLMDQHFGDGPQSQAISVYWMLRSLNVTVAGAYAGQGVSGLLAVACCAWLWIKPVHDARLRVCLTVLLGYFVTPYGYVDDLTAYALVLAMLASSGAHWRNAMLVWAWVLPTYAPVFSISHGVLVTPILILAVLVFSLYAFFSRNNPCSPNRLASAGKRRQGALAPSSSAASQSSTT